ncbi:MAG TPA: hypothetical protein VFB12_18480 [Ktedonobacteraceae bacterium]|nr:hypothetical protein [Ktedonobacteraceae bacterium]
MHTRQWVGTYAGRGNGDYQRVLAHPPTASVTRVNSEVVVELFDGGWLPLDEGVSPTRIIVAGHYAPSPDKKIPVGKRVGEWVYELFITTLPAESFLVEDVLDLYHGRGAFEAVLADEDSEEDPDRWCSYTECGQELWQVACQWAWNLRLSTLEKRCRKQMDVRHLETEEDDITPSPRLHQLLQEHA